MNVETGSLDVVAELWVDDFSHVSALLVCVGMEDTTANEEQRIGEGENITANEEQRIRKRSTVVSTIIVVSIRYGIPPLIRCLHSLSPFVMVSFTHSLSPFVMASLRSFVVSIRYGIPPLIRCLHSL